MGVTYHYASIYLYTRIYWLENSQVGLQVDFRIFIEENLLEFLKLVPFSQFKSPTCSIQPGLMVSVLDQDNNDSALDNIHGERHWFWLHVWLVFKKGKEIIAIQR